jgi:predicted metal-dependent phosphoesterase TrpH
MPQVTNENRFFDIWPRVVRAGSPAVIHVRPRYRHRVLAADAEFAVSVYAGEHMPADSGGEPQARTTIRAHEGRLCFTHPFGDEQHYMVEVSTTGDEAAWPRLRFPVYAVADDLYGLLPLQGDLHMHSYHSDGRESPEFVAASCRRIGLDFMAVTDHGQYAPSIEAQEAFAGVPVDLMICRGEEVHPPGNPVHMISFGARHSVNETIARERPRYDAEVGQLAAGLDPQMSPAARQQVASCMWVFEQIRSHGGLGIFCHPYWHVRSGYTPSAEVTAALFARQPYDAYEVIGGYYRHEMDSNTLQVARYHEETAKGRTLPIVGVSDAHGCETGDLFGWYRTLVFSAAAALDDITAAIRAGRSVAVEAMAQESVRVYGPRRLVQYGLFLLREVLPGHDEICAAEGRLMLDHLDGDEQAGAHLAANRGRSLSYLRRRVGDRA